MKIGRFEIDKSLAASLALHVGVLGWSVLSFAARPLESLPEAVPVDIISSEKLSQITRGQKNGQKENEKPLVEKLGEAKPNDEPVGKVTEKKEVIAANDKPPEPKPPEKKPEPPKPTEQKQDKQVDQIAEALKKDQKKPVEKKETKVEPKKDEKPKKERTFDQSKIAALLDKRSPERNAITGDAVNPKPALGTAAGAAQKLTMSWLRALQERIKECWNMPAGVQDTGNLEIRVAFELRRDGTVMGMPRLMAGPPMVNGPAIGESAIRAIQQCQPYNFLPQAEYAGGWDRLDVTFTDFPKLR